MASTNRNSANIDDDISPVSFQAIVLADTFAYKFRPITLERPKVLLPLVTVPLLDYTLEWLSSSGVTEIFVFCCAHAQQVTDHVARYWSSVKGESTTVIRTVVGRDCISAGDALRHMDQKGVISGDFVLVTGDTVSNVKLGLALQEHRERKKVERQAVMTMLVQKTSVNPIIRQTRLGNRQIVIGIEPVTKQLLLYEKSTKEEASRKATKGLVLEKGVLEGHSQIQLRTDLEDCCISICSPEVLMIFSDNFDYMQIRRDFVRGLLSDDIMGNKIFTYEVRNEYAARVDNLRSYDAVSRDVIQRWAYPLVPDHHFGSHAHPCRVSRGNKYKEDNVQLARTAEISPNTYLGEGTSVGDHSVITNSVIGRNCAIGSNVRIDSCHVWDGVRIDSGASLKQSLLCDNVRVQTRASLEPGTLLSFKVGISPGTVVPPYSKYSMLPQPLEEDSSDEELEYASNVPPAGAGKISAGEDRTVHRGAVEVAEGMGFQWSVKADGALEDEWRQSIAFFPAEKLAELAREARRREADELDEVSRDAEGDVAGKANVEEEDESNDDLESEEDDFDAEVRSLFQRTVEEGANFDNIVLEINALKLGLVRSFADCAGAIFRGMLSLILQRSPTKSAKELVRNSEEVFKKWGPLLRRFLKQQDDEVEVLLTFEEECSEGMEVFSPLFSKMLSLLYDAEIASEEAILAWAEEKSGADESEKTFLKQSSAFIQWLKEADEEEGDSSEEDEA